MALANEVKPFGISVCCIQPGDIKTDFTNTRKKSEKGDEIYKGKISKSVEGMERDEQSGMKPESAGKFIHKIATKKSVKPIYTIGTMYQLFCIIAKILPSRAVNYIIGKMYA